MDLFDYADFELTAQQLLAEAGMRAYHLRPSESSGSDATPWDLSDNNPTATTRTPCIVVQSNYTTEEKQGSLISASDVQLFVSTEGLENLSHGDLFETPIGVYSVVNFERVAPGGRVLLYIVQAKLN